MQTGILSLLLASALVLGGGQGGIGDTFCQVLALAALGLASWRHVRGEARWPAAAWIAALPVAVVVLQLLPLPESVWSWPEARQSLAQDLVHAGVDTSPRMTLQPLGTERALWWLLPGIAMFLGVLQLGWRERRVLLVLLLVLVFAGIVLGLAQLAGGSESGLRFYRITNRTEAVGFFANRNHFASLLAASLPLVIIGTAAWYRRHADDGSKVVLGVIAGAGLIALLILGLALARSRAGLLLGIFAVVVSFPVVWKLRDRSTGFHRVLVAAIAIGLVLAVNFALIGILQRLQKDPFEDARVHLVEVTFSASRGHLPFGSGLGSFRAAFEAQEGLPAGANYVNHAHNDAIELWLETGWLGAAMSSFLMCAFFLAGMAGWKNFKNGERPKREIAAMRIAAWVSLLLMALHSWVDYPLRTTAMIALAGMLAALAARNSEETS